MDDLLSDRDQQAVLSDTVSMKICVNIGLPQGTVLAKVAFYFIYKWYKIMFKLYKG